ncbi:MAG: hypothetical protein SYC29_12020 [Planctomycetota bacterium]|nr:hypothetical protein [Planctomycetota bacterium]
MKTGRRSPLTPDPESDGTPLCPGCLTPVDPLQHYCHRCGTAVGQFTPYIPFVNIPFTISLFDRLWTRLWFPRWESPGRRALYGVALLLSSLLWPVLFILLVGVPWMWVYSRTAPRPGQCPGCAYDLRGLEDRCPECGRPFTCDELERYPPLPFAVHWRQAGTGEEVDGDPVPPG